MSRRGIRVIAVVCAVLVAGSAPVSMTQAQQQGIIDRGFIPAGTQGVIGRQGILMMERPDYMETASVLRGHPRPDSGWKSCSSLSDANCIGAQRIEFGAILQQCATPTSLDCVVAFGVVAADGTKINAAFERKFPAEAANRYSADVASGLPEGGPGALWRVPESAGLEQSLHYVRASVVGSVRNGKATFTGFAASLTPVSMTTMRCDQGITFLRVGRNECTSMDAQTTRDEPGFSGFIEGSGWDQGLDCAMSGNADYTAQTAECALREPALLETKYFLEVRLSQSPQGWLHGRLANADLSITPIAGVQSGITLSIAGTSVRVPIIYKEVPFSSLPTNLQNAYRAKGSWANGSGDASNWGMADTDPKDPNGRNRLSNPPSSGATGIEELEAWMEYLNDTATADRATWSLRTLRNAEREQANQCITDSSRVTGIVLTNATQYLAGAPLYNKATQSLDYKVAAPHLMSNGEVFKGSYELMIRSDVAKCIYGFVTGAVQGTVEVVESEAGQGASVVTNVSERDGWLRLSAAGYTHSAPTLRAVLKEKAATSVKAKKSLSRTKLVKAAGLKTKKTSKVTLKVVKRSAKVCRVQSNSLRALKRGSCYVTVTVKTGKKTTKNTILVTVRK